jgi:peptide/nickel transport system ATP-binding protein
MEKILEVKNLQTYFYTNSGVLKAVDNVSFKISKEETFGIIGESGCGKSTVALSIMKMLDYSARIVGGHIKVGNKDIVKIKKKRMCDIWGKNIFMIFQDPMTSLNPVMNIYDQIKEVIVKKEEKKLKKEVILHKSYELLESVKIIEPSRVLKQFPHQLSGGMKQRIGIAMGLYLNPILLILDEPTTALDSTVQFKIIELIKDLKIRRKMSQLLITHNFGVAAKLCDKIAVMYAGKIIEYGKYQNIFQEPTHPYTIGLFKSVMNDDEETEYLETIKGAPPSLAKLPEGCYFRERCKIAKPICKKKEPKIQKIAEEHFVACHAFR